MSGSDTGSRDLKTVSAALRRLTGSGDMRVRAPWAVCMAARTELLRRTFLSRASVTPSAAAPVLAESSAPVESFRKTPLVEGSKKSWLAARASSMAGPVATPEAASS